jgi:lipopolysaccharide export system permease protein
MQLRGRGPPFRHHRPINIERRVNLLNAYRLGRTRCRTNRGDIFTFMKYNALITRYVLKEMFPPFAVNVLFFMFVFLLTEILDITDMIVNYKVGLWAVLRILAYSMPYFLIFILPMSVMMAVLLTFLRMSGDNEIIALKSSGIGIYQLLPAVFAFCLAGSIITGLMTVYGQPWSRTALKTLTIEIAKSNVDIGLKERTFNNAFKGVMLYVNEIDLKKKELIDVFIQDERNPDTAVTVVAPLGKMGSDPDNLLFHMRLHNGTINQVDLRKKSVNTVHFDTYDIQLDLKQAMENISDEPKNEREMHLTELWAYLQAASSKDVRYYRCLIELHKKFSIPVACFALGILAIPLGVQSKSARKSFGFALGFLLFLGYYLLLSAGMVFGETGAYPPAIGMWLPNIVTGGFGGYLLARTVKGRPIYIDLLPQIFAWLRKA